MHGAIMVKKIIKMAVNKTVQLVDRGYNLSQ